MAEGQDSSARPRLVTAFFHARTWLVLLNFIR
jgi:hypothetical protein